MIFSNSAVNALSIAGFMLLLDGQGTQALDISANPYIKGASVANRSPCPAINAVANHGYVPRDGFNVDTVQLSAALEEVFGVSTAFNTFVINANIEAGLPSVTNPDGSVTVNLNDWYGQFDHDASMLRPDQLPTDPQPQFSQSLFDELAALSTDGVTITKAQMAQHIKKRVKASVAAMPNGGYDIPVNILGIQASLAFVFGEDDSLGTVPLDDLKLLMDDARIPDGYQNRQDRGAPLLFTPEDTVFVPAIAFFNATVEAALEEAKNAPVPSPPTPGAPAPSPVPPTPGAPAPAPEDSSVDTPADDSAAASVTNVLVGIAIAAAGMAVTLM